MKELLITRIFTGQGLVQFSDLIVQEKLLESMVKIECLGTDTSLQATSPKFHVYEAPTTTTIDTGLRTEVFTEFSYIGKLEPVITLISSFHSSMGSITCNQCPRGTD